MKITNYALTYDDVSLRPGYSCVLPKDVSLSTMLTNNIQLSIPVLSAAMDSVTDANMAIALAREGGIGVIHKNLSISEQANNVRKVKKFENGIVKDPITVQPNTTVKEILQLANQYNISGFPVIENNKLLGIVTRRDWRFEEDMDVLVVEIMTKRDKLVTVHEGASSEEIISKMRSYRLEKILITNDSNELVGLVTVKDIQKSKDNPIACKDINGRLRVAAAIGPGLNALERLYALCSEDVDVVVIDTAHGHSQSVLDLVKKAKEITGIQVIAGNIATKEAAIALSELGADAVKVGIGPGSICTTRIISGVGVPQLSAVSEVADALKGSNTKVIADGGIRYSGDIVKALAAGADTIMIGGLLAGTNEAPGEAVLYKGRAYKSYRGMGSVGAMATGSKDRYFQEGIGNDKLVPEGVEGLVPDKGPMSGVIYQLMGGLRSGMGYIGAHNIQVLHDIAQFVQISSAAKSESHVHDVKVTKEPLNYRIEE
ncbi:MAG: IMP dehydrogenase [Francisellaceae bacterium]|jgi:IMP dehydrogenase|nr:IMP dehydrogenase [Francisellaceae bacterium]MBT6206482.1 IMP dehydrogenase [Francisellaceae bacterium]MBT6539198.1 IMP dehydrogenase [Francisellaceae bacterium]